MAKKNVVIIVAAGRGTRMQSKEPKQYLKLNGKPMLYYSIREYEACSFIDEIIVVTSPGDELRTYDDVIDKYHLKKVVAVVPGGAERYLSVYEGLAAIKSDCGYVFVHDGARPCVTKEVIMNAYSTAQAFDACVVGVREKDTIRRMRVGTDVALEALDRDEIWHIQTPQVFSFRLICEAYDRFMERADAGTATDDAMIIEKTLRHPIHVAEGSYENIKVTTHADLAIAECYLKAREKRR